MASTVTYFSRIENGQFTSGRVRNLIKELEGQRVELVLRKRRSYRTHAQNAAFHGPVLGPITKKLRDLGWTGQDGAAIRADEVKEILKFKFLRYDVVDHNTGEIHTFVKETHKLTKSEFSELITDCILWARKELKIEIVIGWDQLEDEGFQVT